MLVGQRLFRSTRSLPARARFALLFQRFHLTLHPIIIRSSSETFNIQYDHTSSGTWGVSPPLQRPAHPPPVASRRAPSRTTFRLIKRALAAAGACRATDTALCTRELFAAPEGGRSAVRRQKPWVLRKAREKFALVIAPLRLSPSDCRMCEINYAPTGGWCVSHLRLGIGVRTVFDPCECIVYPVVCFC